MKIQDSILELEELSEVFKSITVVLIMVPGRVFANLLDKKLKNYSLTLSVNKPSM